MSFAIRITVTKFEDCHAGNHAACKMGTSVEKGELIFCRCECHKARKRKERRGHAER